MRWKGLREKRREENYENSVNLALEALHASMLIPSNLSLSSNNDDNEIVDVQED